MLQAIVNKLITICGADQVYTEKETMLPYEGDEAMGFHFPFDILVKPGTAAEIADVVKVCNEYAIPVTPRGGGSGVTGGALPVKRGVVLSLERLNKIIEINKTENYVLVEAGVITASLCKTIADEGLYFPVEPGSASHSMIGGNVAQNAGSINSCKYGKIDRYVINLEVVLPGGELIWTAANVHKNSTGLNLTQLFTGSEGVLGIITKAVLRLLPAPGSKILMLAAFDDVEAACNVVAAIKASGVKPAAVELIGEAALTLTAEYSGEPFPLMGPDIKAHLLVELEEEYDTVLWEHIFILKVIIKNRTREEILIAENDADREKFWRLRAGIGKALVANNGYYRDIDCCIPLSLLYAYITRVESICQELGVNMVYFGHALDGNLHVMLRTNGANKDENALPLQLAAAAIYRYVTAHGGIISGEHGIGLLQKEYMPLQFSEAQLNVMKHIKAAFDPRGILNPGKMF